MLTRRDLTRLTTAAIGDLVQQEELIRQDDVGTPANRADVGKTDRFGIETAKSSHFPAGVAEPKIVRKYSFVE